MVASGRVRRRNGRVGGADRPAERDLRPGPAARAARSDKRRLVPLRARSCRIGHCRRRGHRPGSRQQAPRLVGSGRDPPERRSQRSRWHDLRESSARGQQPYHARSRPVPSPPAGRAARTSWPRPPAIPSAGSPPPAQRPGAASSTAWPRRPPGEEPRSLPTTGLSKLADTAPWPVIDPAEKGHICAHDQPIRYMHLTKPGRPVTTWKHPRQGRQQRGPGTEWVCGCRLPGHFAVTGKTTRSPRCGGRTNGRLPPATWTPEPDDLRVASGAMGPAVSHAESADRRPPRLNVTFRD